MAGFISKSKTLLRHSLNPFSSSLAVSLRHQSSHSTNPHHLLLKLASSSEVDYDVTMKMFDDLIHRILIKKATPDWLPFVPGSSFWVPPRPTPSNVVEFVHTVNNVHDLSREDSLSVDTLQGWPSSKFFVSESESAHDGDTGVDVSIPEAMEGTMKVKVLTFSDNVAHSEDEEG